MITSLQLNQKYSSSQVILQELHRRVRETMLAYCEKNNYAFSCRVKTLESLAEKIETGRYASWQELDDLFACTIIVPTLDDELKVLQDITHIFQRVKLTKRGQVKKAPDVFRFDSPRLICRLQKPESIENIGLSIYNLLFEVQVRTAFEHAWSVTSHALSYKTDVIDWKRTRLTAQMKAIVEQLDTLIASFQNMVPRIIENPWPEFQAKKRISQAINNFVKLNLLPQELEPKDLSRFCDNFYAILIDNKKEKQIMEAIDLLRTALKKMSIDNVPRSISLLQLVFAILQEQNFISCDGDRYIYNVSPQLEILFPKTGKISRCFDYNI